MSVKVITTAHWRGDPRLNRHRLYLEAAGHQVSILSFADLGRRRALWDALVAVTRSEADTVILPDPELFVLGSLTARLRGKRPVIDIHEDYHRVAAARNWVPAWARPVVAAVAGVMVALGRLVAARVVVAAPELARSGDLLVVNVPDPASLVPAPYDGSGRLVYVGDITEARGASRMVEALARLDERFRLELIGRARPEMEDAVRSLAAGLGVADRVTLTGRLDHASAWERAAGSLAGLSLLLPVPAYLEARATKLWEYMAVGLPVVVSDLPGQAALVARIEPDLVCGHVDQVAEVVRRLHEDPEFRARVVTEGRRLLESVWAETRPDLAIQSVLEP